jgi:adenosylhomocysteine nucleosidase
MNPLLGLVVALPAEARALLGWGIWHKVDGWPVRRSRLKNGSEILCIRSGVGMDQALQVSHTLIAQGVTTLASVGVSGGLHPDMKSGTLIIATSVLEQLENGGEQNQNRVWDVDSTYTERLHAILSHEGVVVHCGHVITTRDPLLTIEEKKSLYEKSQALAVDMESAVVARSAREKGLPFFALRTVCDTFDQPIPREVFNWVYDSRHPKALFIMGKLMRKPALISDVLRMGKDFKTALAALKLAWQLLITHGLQDML